MIFFGGLFFTVCCYIVQSLVYLATCPPTQLSSCPYGTGQQMQRKQLPDAENSSESINLSQGHPLSPKMITLRRTFFLADIDLALSAKMLEQVELIIILHGRYEQEQESQPTHCRPNSSLASSCKKDSPRWAKKLCFVK